MLASRKWALRLSRPTKSCLRHVASKTSPGPRSNLRKPPPPARRDPSRQAPRKYGQPAKREKGSIDRRRINATSNALQVAAHDGSNSLLTHVHVPSDFSGILTDTHPSSSILANSSVVIQRQLEMMNVFLGFEQANKYVIMDPQGAHIGFLAEQDHGMGNAMARQAFRTHRSFTAHVFDREGKEVLRFHRPFSWISSKIRVYDSTDPHHQAISRPSPNGTAIGLPGNQGVMQTSNVPLSEMRIIGEAQQQWAPLRRKYNLFLHRENAANSNKSRPQITSGSSSSQGSTTLGISSQNEDGRDAGMAQFAYVNEPFLSWDFTLRSENSATIGSVNRDFSGFAREIFTDTGVYALRMDSAQEAGGKSSEDVIGMTLDQRAVMLATAVSIDFDYFSRHSSTGTGGFFPFFPMWWGGGGAGAAEAGAAGEAGAVGAGTVAGEAGAFEGAAARGVGGTSGVGMGEGAIAGAGSMAGYEAMQGMRGRSAANQDDTDRQVFGDAGIEPNQAGQYQGSKEMTDDSDRWPWDEPPPGSSGRSGVGDGNGGAEGGGGVDGGDGGDFFGDFF